MPKREERSVEIRLSQIKILEGRREGREGLVVVMPQFERNKRGGEKVELGVKLRAQGEMGQARREKINWFVERCQGGKGEVSEGEGEVVQRFIKRGCCAWMVSGKGEVRERRGKVVNRFVKAPS